MKGFGKIRKVHIVALLVFVVYSVALAGIASAVGNSADPGSDANPLVAKDYVDDVVGKVNAQVTSMAASDVQLNTAVTQMAAQVEELKKQADQLTEQINQLTAQKDELVKSVGELKSAPGGSPGSVALKDIKVPAGKTFIGGENTEFILISGKAAVVSGAGSGLLNESTGTFSAKGAQIVKNNLMLVIKADGRGFKAAAECRVLVRGSYSIK